MSDRRSDVRNEPRFLRLALATCMLAVWGVACSDIGKQKGMDWGQTDYARAGSVEVEPVYRLSGETGFYFGFVVDLAVDGERRLYVADNVVHGVWVISPEGDSLDMVGSRGRAPGEFRRMTDLAIGDKDSLYVLDWRDGEISVFGPGPEYEFVRVFALPSQESMSVMTSEFFEVGDAGFVTVPNVPSVLGDRTRYTPGRWGRLLSKTGELVTDSVFAGSNRQVAVRDGESRSLPFGAGPVTAKGPENRLYYAYTDTLSITWYAPAGMETGEITLPYDPIPLSTEAWENQLRGMDEEDRAHIREYGEKPSHRPVFEELVVDDRARLWIDVNRPDRPRSDWWVLDPDSRKIFVARFPEGLRLVRITSRRAYGILEKQGEGQAVIAYRYQLPKTS